MKTIIKYFFISLFTILLLIGCVSIQPGDSVPAGTSETDSSDNLTTPTIVLPSSVSISPAPTSTRIPTVRGIIPTISSIDAKSLFFNNLKNNGSCLLPCLWSLTPGISLRNDVEDFFSQFGNQQTPDINISTSRFAEGGGVFFINRMDNIHTIVHLSYVESNTTGDLDYLILHGYAMLEKGKDLDWLSPDVSPLYGDPSFNKTFAYYLLPQILTNYGLPDQVLLAAFPDELDRPDEKRHPFSLILFYQEKGIFLEYVFPRSQEGEYYIGCPQEAEIKIVTWNPNRRVSFEDVVAIGGTKINEYNIGYFRKINDATLLTIDQFYQLYINPEQNICLETPMELWPPQ